MTDYNPDEKKKRTNNDNLQQDRFTHTMEGNRSQGRARKLLQQQQQQQQQQQRQRQQFSPAPQPTQSYWGRPPAPSTIGLPSTNRSRVQQSVYGRGLSHPSTHQHLAIAGPSSRSDSNDGNGDENQSFSSKSGGGGGGGGVSNIRGRLTNVIVHTKPNTITSKRGTTGRPIQLLTNYFSYNTLNRWSLYHYNVIFEPVQDDLPKKREYFKIFAQGLITYGYLFDGTSLFCPQRMAEDHIENSIKDSNNDIVRITIKRVGEVRWGDPTFIQLFNIIIRKCSRLSGFELIGRNFYDMSTSKRLERFNLELITGVFTSTRQHEKEVLLNVDILTKVLRIDTVYDTLLECLQGSNVRNEFLRKVIGSVIITTYNNRTYRIDDVLFDKTPLDTFEKSDGTRISYKEYYRTRYNLNIRDDSQPMLVSRCSKREIRAGQNDTYHLVPELCKLTGLTDKQRENFQLTRALAEQTRLEPGKRMNQIKTFVSKLISRPECMEEIRRWDLNIGQNLVQLAGRILPRETILFGGVNYKTTVDNNADWTISMRSAPMFNPIKTNQLVMIVPNNNINEAEQFKNLLIKCAKGMKWNIPTPIIYPIQDDRLGSYLRASDQLIPNRPELIIFILSKNTVDRYSAIKKKCSIELGISSQVVLIKSITAKSCMSIATKIVIQLNCKLGGAPWAVAVPLSSVMVIGYDVCRDTVNKKKCFAAMVASIDKHFTRYYHRVTEHENEQELSNNFSKNVLLACDVFKKENGNYPERIIIIRDGVGAGQLPYVYSHEVIEIKTKLIQEIYKDPNKLRWAFIIVNKRIPTKFVFNNGNPPFGTVVDDIVTYPERYDFYLISPCVRQGTVNPTYYNTIADTLGLPPDKLQIFMYKLTHMYYNWSGTIRVPAPVQYAHKLAFMVTQYLHRPAHVNLDKSFYYL